MCAAAAAEAGSFLKNILGDMAMTVNECICLCRALTELGIETSAGMINV